MIIDCVADLHGFYPKLEGGDLLIVAGDLTRSDQNYQYEFLYDILAEKEYKKIIVTAGNHDSALQDGRVELVEDSKIEYLCDSGTEFEGLNIWGSPWTKRFEGISPRCMAFTVDTEYELAKKWELIPQDTDILVTHSPPYGFFDTIIKVAKHERKRIPIYTHCGSSELEERLQIIKPKLHVFGHIHEGYGWDQFGDIITVNASHVNEHYEPVNKPIRIEL